MTPSIQINTIIMMIISVAIIASEKLELREERIQAENTELKEHAITAI